MACSSFSNSNTPMGTFEKGEKKGIDSLKRTCEGDNKILEVWKPEESR